MTDDRTRELALQALGHFQPQSVHDAVVAALKIANGEGFVEGFEKAVEEAVEQIKDKSRSLIKAAEVVAALKPEPEDV